MATRLDHAVLKGPTMKIHAVEGGFLPVLLYWRARHGQLLKEWYRYKKSLPTREEAERLGLIEKRKMKRHPQHYFCWPSDPWEKFDGDIK